MQISQGHRVKNDPFGEKSYLKNIEIILFIKKKKKKLFWLFFFNVSYTV